LHPSRKYIDAKIRTWVDFLGQYMPAVIARDIHLLDEHTKSVREANKTLASKKNRRA
jgi:hypothetical protein